MSVIHIEVRIPSLHCDWCGHILYPAGLNHHGLQTISLHRLDGEVSCISSSSGVFVLTGFTDADLDNQGQESGWRFLEIYNRRFNICPGCQKKGSDPAFDHRLKRLALLLGMRTIKQAETLDQAKETAEIALREGEEGL